MLPQLYFNCHWHPRSTFLNYCIVTSVEEFVKKDVVKKTIRDSERAAEEQMEENNTMMNIAVVQEAELVKMGLTDGHRAS